MSCGGCHLGFQIGIKNRNLVKDIHLQFGFSQLISFREEDLWNFRQSEHSIGPGSHVEYPTGTKNRNFVEDHPRNIPVWFQLAQWFWRRSLKCEKFTDDRRRTPSDGNSSPGPSLKTNKENLFTLFELYLLFQCLLMFVVKTFKRGHT